MAGQKRKIPTSYLNGFEDGGLPAATVEGSSAVTWGIEGKAPSAGRSDSIPRSRTDNSISVLTRKFVALTQGSPNGTIDLNVAAVELQVCKRRLYDITNVLETIGLIRKQSTNTYAWKGTDQGQEDVTELIGDIARLISADKELDVAFEHVALLRQRFVASERPMMFMRHSDISSIPDLRGKTMITIRAPVGTTLEIPDPDKAGLQNLNKYRLELSSPGEGINACLIDPLSDSSSHAQSPALSQTVSAWPYSVAAAAAAQAAAQEATAAAWAAPQEAAAAAAKEIQHPPPPPRSFDLQCEHEHGQHIQQQLKPPPLRPPQFVPETTQQARPPLAARGGALSQYGGGAACFHSTGAAAGHCAQDAMYAPHLNLDGPAGSSCAAFAGPTGGSLPSLTTEDHQFTSSKNQPQQWHQQWQLYHSSNWAAS